MSDSDYFMAEFNALAARVNGLETRVRDLERRAAGVRPAIDVMAAIINAEGTRPTCMKCGAPDVLHFVPGPCQEPVFERPDNPEAP